MQVFEIHCAIHLIRLMQKSALTASLLAIFYSQVHAADSSAAAESMVIPAPRSGLPIPYERSQFAPQSPADEAYAKYLRTTPMIPSELTCSHHLLETLQRLRPSDVLPVAWYEKRTDLGTNAPESAELISNKWVTIPYLAWGGNPAHEVAIGPLRSAFSIIESHLSYKSESGETKNATYSCFVQYASQSEHEIWSRGALKYGAFLAVGHRQYLTGPASTFAAAPPGPASKWDPNIRYYQK